MTQATGAITPEELRRHDVQRFGRIMRLMTAEQIRQSGEGLVKIEQVPDQLARSLTTAEIETARLMLAWIARWKARNAKRQIHAMIPPQPGLAPLWPSSSSLSRLAVPMAQAPAVGVRPEGAATGSIFPGLYRGICQTLVDRSRELEEQTERAIQDMNAAINRARSEYQAALDDKQAGNQTAGWSHILEAMKELDKLQQFNELITWNYNESTAILGTLNEALPCRHEVKERLDRIYANHKAAPEIGPAYTRSLDLWQLHSALIMLARQIDEGEEPDPSVSCIDLTQTGDFWNWLWKQARGGAYGDTNPPGWFPVDLFHLIQPAFGKVAYINMEPDGDIHINLSEFDIPGMPSVSALINGTNPNGQLICEIPLCDRSWFQNLPQVCVGKLVYVVGKWMIDIWNGWYELHPLYQLSVVTPIMPGHDISYLTPLLLND